MNRQGRGIIVNNQTNNKKKVLDPATTVIPLIIISILCILFITMPEASTNALSAIREFLGNELGVFYLAVGLGVVVISLYIAFSDLGKIRLGKPTDKPEYGFWIWGAMVFTCGLAADILFYSLCEWIFYLEEPRAAALGNPMEWAATYTLFHWGPIPWGFYAMLAACFGFMLHTRNRKKQKYSEACRPVLGKQTDTFLGRAIDVIAVIALIAGCATTFSVATPLLSMAVTTLIGIPSSKFITIGILAVTCAIYTLSVRHGLKGVEKLSSWCMYLFIALMAYVFIFGGEARFTIETGFMALGNMVQNFIGLSTWTEPLRETGFTVNWTIFYWAYWMVWCVAAPFFMGGVSRGRTVKQVILGSYIFGLASTFASFIIIGNFGLGMQMHGRFDAMAFYHANGEDLYLTVMEIVKQLPLYQIVLVLIMLSMIAFYASSFDSITLVASQYSYRESEDMESAPMRTKMFWAILLILLPMALIFSEGSMSNMQTVSIIAAFPIAFIIILIIVSFMKDGKNYLKESGQIKDDA